VIPWKTSLPDLFNWHNIFKCVSWILLWLDRKTPPPQGAKQWHNGASSPLSWSPDVQPISNPWCLCFHHGLNLRVSPRLRCVVRIFSSLVYLPVFQICLGLSTDWIYHCIVDWIYHYIFRLNL
jgi:hypothetical protein